jgi:hypothetical protein
VTPSRRFLLLLLIVSCFGVTVPAAWASFTNPTTRGAVATFTTTSIVAPTVSTAVRCLVTNTIPVTWTHSSSTFVTSQLVEVSTSSTMATIAKSVAFNDNTTQSTTMSGLGTLSSLTTYYARVTAKFSSWSTASAIFTTTFSAC